MRLSSSSSSSVYIQRRQWHPTPVLLPGKSHGRRSLGGCSPWGRLESDTTERLHFTFHFHALEKEMATHSSILAWRIPGMGEPGGLPSMGSHRVGHDWSDLAAAVCVYIYIYIHTHIQSYSPNSSHPLLPPNSFLYNFVPRTKFILHKEFLTFFKIIHCLWIWIHHSLLYCLVIWRFLTCRLHGFI